MVVRIFKDEWSAEKRKTGTIDELNKAAELRARAELQVDPASSEFVRPQGGRPRKGETVSNAYGLSDSARNSKPGILRRLAREGRTDLLDRFERGDISANRAAIEAGFRKPPKPRPTTPIEILDWDAQVAATAEAIRREKEAAIPGARGKGRPAKNKRNNVPFTGAKGNAREARIAQLKKAGREDLVEKVISGEMSANAAAIAAGLKRPPKPHPACYGGDGEGGAGGEG